MRSARHIRARFPKQTRPTEIDLTLRGNTVSQNGIGGVNATPVPPITPAAGIAMVRRQLAAMVGMSCHYVAPGSGDGVYPPVCRAATITEALDLESGQVGLMIANPTGVHFRQDVPYDPAGASYTWHWPETV